MIAEVKKLLDEKEYSELCDLLCEKEPADIARIFDQLTNDEMLQTFRALKEDIASSVFVELESDLQQALMEGFTDQELSDIMNGLDLDDAVDIIDGMPASIVRRILRHSEPERRRQLNKLFNPPEDPAGTNMATELVRMKARFTEVRSLLDEKKYRELRDLLCEEEPADIAQIFDQFPKDEVSLMFRVLHKDFASEVFVEMDSDLQQALIEGFTDQELSDIMNDLFLDDTVDVIEEMPASVVRRILKHTEPERRRQINKLLNYPEDSAGTIMTTEFVRLKAHFTVSDAFKTIRRQGVDKETIYTCYVTDEHRVLLGVVTVKQLLLAEEDTVLEDIMIEDPIFAHTDDDKKDVSLAMSKYDFLAMPVVDSEQRLVGIVTVDDALDVIQEEDTEDIEMMAAITPSDKPYLKTGVFETWKNRIPWLLILMISATFTSKILTHFEGSLATLPVLTAFVPLLMGTGGNAGSQASVSVIRALSLGDVQMKDFFKVFLKETMVALLCGISLGIVNFGKMFLFNDVSRAEHGLEVSIGVSLVVSIAIAITVIIAKISGGMLPILVKRIGLDPAVMASPLITTIVDVLSLLVYLGIAQAILGYFGISI